MKKMISTLLLALFTLSLSACGAPTPEDLCAKAEKDKDKCVAELKKMQEGLGEDLWKEFAKCAKDKDPNKDDGKEMITCLNGDMIKKMMEKEGK